MRILITGYKGQMGSDLVNEIKLRHPEDTIIGMDIAECNLCNGPEVVKFIKENKPDAIMHLAAYTAVDKAESDSMNCYDVNVLGTAAVAIAAEEIGAKLLYISSDYVFDGKKDGPYKVDDSRGPLSVYGMSKALGEDAVLRVQKHFIVRTSWVFGKNGHNFIYTMLNLAKTGINPKVVDDTFGSPTYTIHLCPLLDDMIHSDKYGIYHATNEDYVSWYQYAKLVFEKAGYPSDGIVPIPTSSYPSPAKKPLNSRLDKTCLDIAGFKRLPSVEEAIVQFLKETNNLREK